MKPVSFKQSRNSDKDYFRWRKYRTLQALNKIEKTVKLKNLEVLDFGFGYGSLISVLLDRGAKVTGVEIDKKAINIAKKFLGKDKNYKLSYLKDGKLPFGNENFDMVFLFDVIEHVKRPDIVMKECQRVLKSNGIIYIEFTPFYSLIGHHLYDVTKWPIHYLPEKLTKHDFKSLNKLKISEFQQLTRSFKKIEERFIIKYPEVFEINLPFIKWLGPLKDIFTFSFIGIYQKR